MLKLVHISKIYIYPPRDCSSDIRNLQKKIKKLLRVATKLDCSSDKYLFFIPYFNAFCFTYD